MYLSAMNIPTSILSQFIGGIPLVVLSLSGFKTNDVDDANDDDSINARYDWDKGSLWILRVSSSFIVAMLTFSAFWNMRDYGLTTKIAEQMNKVNVERELREGSVVGETPMANDSSSGASTENIDIGGMSEEAMMATRESEIDGEVVKVTDYDRQLLLHLSVAELFRIYSAINSNVYQVTQGLPLIQKLLGFGCLEAFITDILVIIAIAYDQSYLGSSFDTLLIYLLVLVAFYILYEASRFTAINKISKWEPKDLKLKAKAVYKEFSRKADTLQQLLAKAGINPDGSKQEDDMISVYAGLRPSSIVGKNADEAELEAEAFVNLSGYKRIFSLIAAILTFAVILIIVASANAD